MRKVNSASKRSNHLAAAVTSPPLQSYVKLLNDPERDVDLKRLLRKYSDPKQQQSLLRILQDAKFSHILRTTRGSLVSRARPWVKRRDRWRAGVSRLDKELEALLIQFRDSIYPVLRASNSLPEAYSRNVANLFTAIERVKVLANSNPILTLTFTTRGHQTQPYIDAAIKAMRAIKMTKADAQDLLVWTGVKRDPFSH